MVGREMPFGPFAAASPPWCNLRVGADVTTRSQGGAGGSTSSNNKADGPQNLAPIKAFGRLRFWLLGSRTEFTAYWRRILRSHCLLATFGRLPAIAFGKLYEVVQDV
jgi:hypothetical protein